MRQPRVSVMDGVCFVVSDRSGDMLASPQDLVGLFSFDTRFLSRWVLTVNGQRLTPLSVDDLQHFETRYFLVPGEPTHYVSSTMTVIRHRTVGLSFGERITILNHHTEPVDVTVRIEAGSDFADIFELRAPDLIKKGNYHRSVGEDHLFMLYQRESFQRGTVVKTSESAQIDLDGLTYSVRVPSHGSWSTELRVETAVETPSGTDLRGEVRHQIRAAKETNDRELREWLEKAPRLHCENQPLVDTYRRSMLDLAALRHPDLTTGQKMPSAGLPWFMTLVGRQSLITSLQILPYVPTLAATTLRVLALLQGAKLDDFRDEEPGKIVHQIRYGESAAFEETPHSQHYGAVDATPLFIVLLDEYERWTGDADLVRQLEREARAALAWLDDFGDLNGDGYVWYQRPTAPSESENQVWKESRDAICYSDGRLPGFPRATCELQGYAYDARLRGARLARKFWNDPTFADRLERQAAQLRERFNRDFWIADRGYYALALEADGSQVDALASNQGHLLWSGIVDQQRAAAIVEHLMGPTMFSGWGIRTLASTESRYNPVGGHVGTVWPYDNSIIADGMRHYNFRDEAGRITQSIIDMASFFHGRLPEAFAGYERELTKHPVWYPTGNSPQGWSAGAPLLLLRAIFGMDPRGEHLIVDPAIPDSIGQIELLDIPGRWGLTDAFGRPRTSPAEGTRPGGT